MLFFFVFVFLFFMGLFRYFLGFFWYRPTPFRFTPRTFFSDNTVSLFVFLGFFGLFDPRKKYDNGHNRGIRKIYGPNRRNQ